MVVLEDHASFVEHVGLVHQHGRSLVKKHSGHFASHFVFKSQLKQFAPSRRMECRPDDLSGGFGRFLVEAYISGQGFVGFSAGQ